MSFPSKNILLYLSIMRFQLSFTRKYPCKQPNNLRLTYCTSRGRWKPLQPAPICSQIRLENNVYISKMYFSLWKPPGVSERMWSANLEASISGEYQTLGGHSGWPSELLGSLVTGTGVTGISDDWYRSIMGVIGISLEACRSARENIGCTGECRRTNVGITNEL